MDIREALTTLQHAAKVYRAFERLEDALKTVEQNETAIAGLERRKHVLENELQSLSDRKAKIEGEVDTIIADATGKAQARLDKAKAEAEAMLAEANAKLLDAKALQDRASAMARDAEAKYQTALRNEQETGRALADAKAAGEKATAAQKDYEERLARLRSAVG